MPSNPSNLAHELPLMACVNMHLDLYQRLVVLYRTIHRLAPNAKTYVLGYPRFFPPIAPGTEPTDVPHGEHFSSQEVFWINERIRLADEVIHAAVAASGVAQYVDVYDALNSHELGTGDPNFVVNGTGDVICNGGAYINGVPLAAGVVDMKILSRDGSPEAVHPNPCGHQAFASILANTLSSSNYPSSSFTPPNLPPAGRISVGSFHQGLRCDATFSATVDKSRSGAVDRYEWYDESGNLVSTGSSMSMSSFPNHFQFYLRTVGKNGEDRYTFFPEDGKTFSVCKS
jgi:hypothetical protein